MADDKLTDEERELVKRGTHPVSPEMLAWADAQARIVEIEKALGETLEFKGVDEFRKEVYRRYPHLCPPPPAT